MSSTYKANKKSMATVSTATSAMNIGIFTIMVVLTLSSVGCSTTQEFKPTASVLVGGQKSI